MNSSERLEQVLFTLLMQVIATERSTKWNRSEQSNIRCQRLHEKILKLYDKVPVRMDLDLIADSL